MKRYATLALAAIFALSFTANAAAAPVFSGEFSVETEATLTEGSGIDFDGGPDLTFTLSAAEEGLWSLDVELGSIAASPVDVVTGVTLVDSDGDGDLDSVDAETATVTTNGVEIGAYALSLTPGPFGLTVWGNEYEIGSEPADAFEFISSGDEPVDAKFRLTTDVAGVGLTVDYETNGDDADALYAFAKAGMIGVAFQDTDVADSEAGMGASADVTTDLGIASVTAGAAFDLNAEEGNGSLAFGVEAEAEVVPGLTVTGGYTSDGRGVAEDSAVTEISAGATYALDAIEVGADFSLATDASDVKTTTIGGSVDYGEIASVSVEYLTTTATGDDDPTLTFEASAEYPVIADVLTVSGDFLMVNDKQPLGAGDDYEWVDTDETAIGDAAYTVLQIGASADYSVTSAFTVTPGFEYAAYTFDADGNDKATATILSLDATYAVSEAAEIAFGISNIATDVAAGVTAVSPADRTELSAGVTISF